MNYKSQWKQDEFLYKVWFERCPPTKPFFVDIGAHDGISGSNTYFFEKELKWQGICIEPILERYNQLVKNRDCFCLNCCIFDKVARVPFTENHGYTEMLSGITETYDIRHQQRIVREQQSEGGDSTVLYKSAYPLNSILDLHEVKEVDYLSIDTEGSEFNILNSLDYDKFFIKTISVENNYPDDFARIHSLLLSKNFTHVARLGGDEIYFNNKLPFKIVA